MATGDQEIPKWLKLDGIFGLILIGLASSGGALLLLLSYGARIAYSSCVAHARWDGYLGACHRTEGFYIVGGVILVITSAALISFRNKEESDRIYLGMKSTLIAVITVSFELVALVILAMSVAR